MAAPSLTYTLTNGTTADADQVMQNFNDLKNGYTDGTKDLTINALTANGAVVLNGAVTLGDGSVDDITINGSLASSIAIKTTQSYDIGSATVGLRSVYFGSADSAARSTRVIGATVASSYTITLPPTDGNAGDVVRVDGSGTLHFLAKKNYSLAGTVGSNALTIALKDAGGSDASSSSPIDIEFRNATLTTGTPVVRQVSAALSTVISSTSTAGFTSAFNEYLYIYAIDNAGTVELAWAGTRIFDENTVYSTTAEGGAGAADDKYTLYSTTARSNVAIRLLGRMKFSLTTAGTWNEVPDEVSVAAPASHAFRSEIIVTTGNGHGSTSTRVRRFSVTETNVGSAISYADSATAGGTFTIAEGGMFAIDYFDTRSAADGLLGISVDSNQLTTDIDSITAAHRKAFNHAATNRVAQCSCVIRLNPGQVVRAHTDGSADGGGSGNSRFSIRKVCD